MITHRRIRRYMNKYPNQEYGTKLIKNQHDYVEEAGTYGILGSIPANACGSVAYHNILCMMNRPVKYSETLSYIRRKWLFYTFMGGLGGTDVFSVYRMLRKQGLTLKLYINKKKIPKNYDAYLIFFRFKNFFHGHFTAARYEIINGKKRLVTYNNYVISDDFNSYRKNRKAWLMLVWGVR